MEFHRFIPVYNSPYSPDFNPIEQVFGNVKRDIKRDRLQMFMKNQDEDLNKIIRQGFRNVDRNVCEAFVNHSLRLLS